MKPTVSQPRFCGSKPCLVRNEIEVNDAPITEDKPAAHSTRPNARRPKSPAAW